MEVTYNDVPTLLAKLYHKVDRLEKYYQNQRPLEDRDKLYTVSQACDFLSICKPTLYALTSKGRIDFQKPAKRIYFTKQNLLDYLAQK